MTYEDLPEKFNKMIKAFLKPMKGIKKELNIKDASRGIFSLKASKSKTYTFKVSVNSLGIIDYKLSKRNEFGGYGKYGIFSGWSQWKNSFIDYDDGLNIRVRRIDHDNIAKADKAIEAIFSEINKWEQVEKVKKKPADNRQFMFQNLIAKIMKDKYDWHINKYAENEQNEAEITHRCCSVSIGYNRISFYCGIMGQYITNHIDYDIMKINPDVMTACINDVENMLESKARNYEKTCRELVNSLNSEEWCVDTPS